MTSRNRNENCAYRGGCCIVVVNRHVIVPSKKIAVLIYDNICKEPHSTVQEDIPKINRNSLHLFKYTSSWLCLYVWIHREAYQNYHSKIIVASPQQLRTGMKQDSVASRVVWFYCTDGGRGVIRGSFVTVFSTLSPFHLFPTHFLRSQPLPGMILLRFPSCHIFHSPNPTHAVFTNFLIRPRSASKPIPVDSPYPI